MEYIEELQARLEMSNKIAVENTKTAQAHYVSQYNRRVKDKSFQEGDEVLVLMPDSTKKLQARWMGPGIINRALSKYSYLIAMADGSIRRLHANRLRHVTKRVERLFPEVDSKIENVRIVEHDGVFYCSLEL